MDTNTTEWIRCPICGSKIWYKMRRDIMLKNSPLFCPKCKHENLINVKELQMAVISEPAAKPQS